MIPEVQNGGGKWFKTQYANLRRYIPSGVYHSNAKVRGRLIRRSLKTKSLEIAKLKLDLLLERERSKAPISADEGGTFKQIADDYILEVKSSHRLKQRSKDYRVETLELIRRTWPGIDGLNPQKITLAQLLDWSRKIAPPKYSASRYNGAVETMRGIFRLATDRGIVAENPANKVKRASIVISPPAIPERRQFSALLKRLNKTPRFKESAQLIRFLAFTGVRIGAIPKIFPANLDLRRNAVILPPHKWQDLPVRIPMIPEMRRLAKQLLRRHSGDGPLFQVENPRKILRNACKDIGIANLTPHDLRHIFATRCLESGVDVRTVAEWLCHRDGGALLLKRYAHLRNDHSQRMARRVKF